MKTCLLALSLICSNFLVLTSQSLAEWDFESNQIAGGSFVLPISPSFTDPEVSSALAWINPLTNNNGTPDACNGNESWGTNFWTTTSNSDGERIIFNLTATANHALEITGISFYLSRTPSAVQNFDLAYDQGSGEVSIAAGVSIIHTDPACGMYSYPVSITSSAGGAVSFYIYPYNSLAGAATLRVDDVTISGATLPVELSGFEAQRKDLKVELLWSTASEVNNDYFEIQRSTDGRDFEEISRISGAGTTGIPRHYSFIDEAPFPGINYYRLKQVDFDGQAGYSEVRSVNFEQSKTSAKVFPNPASDVIHLAIRPSSTKRSIQVLNCMGQVLLESSLPEDVNKWEMDIGFLPSGVYLLYVSRERVPIIFCKK